jgi:putative membrane protein
MSRYTILFPAVTLLLASLALSSAAAADQTAEPPHPSAQDRSFLQQVVREYRSETDLARLALRKSSDPQVRSYAQAVVASDAAVEKNAQKMAPASTPAATPATAAEYQKLAKLPGREFDQEYMSYEAGRQQQELQGLRKEISTTDDANLLDFGIKTEVPTQEDAKEAKQLASELGGNLSAKNGNSGRVR